MKAVSLPVSFSIRRLSSATTGIKSGFLRHATATRLVAAHLLFTVALVMVPKADIAETPFDEANTPTSEMAMERTASPSECGQSLPSPVLRIFSQPRRISVRRVLPAHPGRLTDSRRFRELFCSLLCSSHSHDTTALWFGLSCGPFVGADRRSAVAGMLHKMAGGALIKQSKPMP
jgi:hypothetical protein